MFPYSLGKTTDRNCGLPRDVFQSFESDVTVKTSVKFLRASSSSPAIYGDVKTVKRQQRL